MQCDQNYFVKSAKKNENQNFWKYLEITLAWLCFSNYFRGRDEFKMPNVDIRGKLASMNVKVKSARMPSPHELRESYLNSGFHKSFKQPLAVRTRVEDVDTQKARQLLTEKMTPIQLGNLKHPLDIPLPKINLKPSAKTEDDER